jgi:hypothetical protein
MFIKIFPKIKTKKIKAFFNRKYAYFILGRTTLHNSSGLLPAAIKSSAYLIVKNSSPRYSSKPFNIKLANGGETGLP